MNDIDQITAVVSEDFTVTNFTNKIWNTCKFEILNTRAKHLLISIKE